MTEDGMRLLRERIKVELKEMFGGEPTDDMYRAALGAAYPLVFPENVPEWMYKRALRAFERGAARASQG